MSKPIVFHQQRRTLEDVKLAQTTLDRLLDRLVVNPWMTNYERNNFKDLLTDALLSSCKELRFSPLFKIGTDKVVRLGTDFYHLGMRLRHWYPDKQGFIIINDGGKKYKVDMRKIFFFYRDGVEKHYNCAQSEALHASQEMEKKDVTDGTTFRVEE